MVFVLTLLCRRFKSQLQLPLHACPSHSSADVTKLCLRLTSVILGWFRALLGAHAALRGAALLALPRLMCTSAQFCDDNLRLLVTLLHTRCAGRAVHSEPTHAYLCAAEQRAPDRLLL